MHFTKQQWDTAYAWLCKRRCNYPANSDIWHLRFHWAREKSRLITELDQGHYQFDPMQRITTQAGQTIHLWSSRDVLVLKCITLHLETLLPVSKLCTHVKAHGGLKATVNQVNAQREQYQYVIRTDVKAYYASINHHLAINQLSIYIKDKTLLNLLWQYMNRAVERGGLFKEITKGISRGCPLSPLIGAFFLNELDEGFEQEGLFYVRYMDDILILTKTRWKCRRAVKQLNAVFNQLELEKHPDKTFIGKIEKGFDFLGYHFSRKPVTVAAITVQKHVLHYFRLYEQLRIKKATSEEMAYSLDRYVKRWQRWCTAGLDGFKVFTPSGETKTDKSREKQDGARRDGYGR